MPRLKNSETVTLEYRDVDLIKTHRTVDLIETRTENGRTYLETFCHARGEPRTFRSDRIDAVIDENGEVFDAAQFLHALTSDSSRVYASLVEQAEAEGSTIIHVKIHKDRRRSIGRLAKILSAVCAVALGFSFELNEPGSIEERMIILLVAWITIYIPVWIVVWAARRARRVFWRKHHSG